MTVPVESVLQVGLPDLVVALVGLAAMSVLFMLLLALGGFAYKSYTGGIEWPDERDADDDEVRKGTSDEEWEYY